MPISAKTILEIEAETKKKAEDTKADDAEIKNKAENVKGLLSANKGEAFPLILEEFRKVGYHIQYSILNASHFGIPQKRERDKFQSLAFFNQFPKRPSPVAFA